MSQHLEDLRLRENFLIGLTAFFIATFFFAIFSQIDIAVSGLFYSQTTGFTLDNTYVGEAVRNVFKLIFIVAIVISFGGMVMLLAFGGKAAARVSAKWVFLFLCIVVGPGLIANLLFKSNWGRARPVHLVEFGGNKDFTEPLKVTDQCAGSNCAFVSGEASNIYSVFFALALLSSGVIRRRMFNLAIAGGMAAGLVRIAQGGHFLSDIVFAGVFMWFTSLALWWLIFRFWPLRVEYIDGLKTYAYRVTMRGSA